MAIPLMVSSLALLLTTTPFPQTQVMAIPPVLLLNLPQTIISFLPMQHTKILPPVSTLTPPQTILFLQAPAIVIPIMASVLPLLPTTILFFQMPFTTLAMVKVLAVSIVLVILLSMTIMEFREQISMISIFYIQVLPPISSYIMLIS